jgi:hypothetical protein
MKKSSWSTNTFVSCPVCARVCWTRYTHDRQCTCNITLRCFLVTIFAVEKHKYYIFLVFVCNLSYPTRKPQVSYCRMRLVWPYRIFPHSFINGTIFWKGSFEINLFWLFLQVLSETVLTLRRNQRDINLNAHTPLCKWSVILVRF